MKPIQITGYMLEEKYLISGGKIYEIQRLTGDEGLAEMFNAGDVLPMIPAALRVGDVRKVNKI